MSSWIETITIHARTRKISTSNGAQPDGWPAVEQHHSRPLSVSTRHRLTRVKHRVLEHVESAAVIPPTHDHLFPPVHVEERRLRPSELQRHLVVVTSITAFQQEKVPSPDQVLQGAAWFLLRLTWRIVMKHNQMVWWSEEEEEEEFMNTSTQEIFRDDWIKSWCKIVQHPKREKTSQIESICLCINATCAAAFPQKQQIASFDLNSFFLSSPVRSSAVVRIVSGRVGGVREGVAGFCIFPFFLFLFS